MEQLFYDFFVSRTLTSSRSQRDGKHLKFSHNWISFGKMLIVLIHNSHRACLGVKIMDFLFRVFTRRHALWNSAV